MLRHTGNRPNAFDAVWQPSIEFLIQVEEIGLDDRLRMHVTWGLGGPICSRPFPRPSDNTQWLFYDKLVSERDDFWTRRRTKVEPSTLTLPAPWPRGLPIQGLHAGFCEGEKPQTRVSAVKDMPRLLSRAERIVFCDRETALSTARDEGVQYYAESYQVALKLWVSSTDLQDQTQRAKRAWNYVLGELSLSLTADEAVCYWGHIFDSAGVTVPDDLELLQSRTVRLPNPEVEPVRWNPDPSESNRKFKTRKLPDICLNYMLNVTQLTNTLSIATDKITDDYGIFPER